MMGIRVVGRPDPIGRGLAVSLRCDEDRHDQGNQRAQERHAAIIDWRRAPRHDLGIIRLVGATIGPRAAKIKVARMTS